MVPLLAEAFRIRSDREHITTPVSPFLHNARSRQNLVPAAPRYAKRSQHFPRQAW